MLSICTNAIVVLISRSPLDLSRRSKRRQRRDRERGRLAPALRQVAAERRAALVQVLHFRRFVGRVEERHVRRAASSVTGMLKRSRKLRSASVVSFLVWCGSG